MGALKPPGPKFRVAFGSGLVGWAPVPEELIEGGAGSDRVGDQRFDGGDSLVRVHVQLLVLQPDSSCTTVNEMGFEMVMHRLGVFTQAEQSMELVGAWGDWAKCSSSTITSGDLVFG